MNEKTKFIKLVLLGDSGVGKTTLISNYLNKPFHQHHVSTIGAGFFELNINVGEEIVSFHVWDTGGQEVYKSLVPQYLRGAESAFILFDVTNIDSFNNINKWYEMTKNVSPNINVILFGNKNDLENSRIVSIETINQFIIENNFIYFEGSAINKIGISEAFDKMAEISLTYSKNKIEIPSINLSNVEKNNSYCC